MNRVRAFKIALVLAALLTACQTSPGSPVISAQDVWSRPAAAGSTGAVFMTLTNTGDEADRLVSASADVAQAVEIHRTTMEGDAMRMERVEYVEIPAGGQVELAPGGYHIMLIDLDHNLELGDTFEVALELELSGSLTVQSEVRQP